MSRREWRMHEGRMGKKYANIYVPLLRDLPMDDDGVVARVKVVGAESKIKGLGNISGHVEVDSPVIAPYAFEIEDIRETRDATREAACVLAERKVHDEVVKILRVAEEWLDANTEFPADCSRIEVPIANLVFVPSVGDAAVFKYGYPVPEPVLGVKHSVDVFVHRPAYEEDELEVVTEAWSEVFSLGGAVEVEFEVERFAGSMIPVIVEKITLGGDYLWDATSETQAYALRLAKRKALEFARGVMSIVAESCERWISVSPPEWSAESQDGSRWEAE